MRAFFKKSDLAKMFADIQDLTGLSWSELAKTANVSARNLLDWRKGVVSIPVSFLDLIQKRFSLALPSPDRTMSESEMKSRSGALGGIARNKLYGNPGTPQSRRLGGIRSYQKQARNPLSPFRKKKMKIPHYSADLAEFVGIVLGDGGVTRRQVTISLHKEDDKAYAKYVASLIYKIFKISVVIKERSDANVATLTVSRTNLVDFLSSMHIRPGNKVRHQVRVPDWIMSSDTFKRSCVRGLFDTDGCVYSDFHTHAGKVYENPGVNFSNRSKPILSFIRKTLTELDFSPTTSTPNAIVLRKERDVVRYFCDIGSSNPKNTLRFETYVRHTRRRG